MVTHDDTVAWLKGLSPRGAYAIKVSGLATKESVREAIAAGALTPELTPQLGNRTFLEICAWCGVETPRRPPPMRKPAASEKTLAKARRTLERAGYVVIKP